MHGFWFALNMSLSVRLMQPVYCVTKLRSAYCFLYYRVICLCRWLENETHAFIPVEQNSLVRYVLTLVLLGWTPFRLNYKSGIVSNKFRSSSMKNARLNTTETVMVLNCLCSEFRPNYSQKTWTWAPSNVRICAVPPDFCPVLSHSRALPTF